MARITFVTNGGKVVEAADGGTLLHASLRHQGGIPFKCAGGKCGTCRCRIDAGAHNLGDIHPKERAHLTEEDFAGGWRMACQTLVKGGEVSVSWIPLAERTGKTASPRLPSAAAAPPPKPGPGID